VADDEMDLLEDIESYSPSVKNIDTVITVIAVLHVLSGIIAIPIAYVLLSTNIFQAPVIITILMLIDIALLITSVPLYFILGWAIWSLQPWAWKVAIITNVILLTIYVIGEMILPALLNIVFLFALFSSDVRLALAPFEE